MSLSFPAYPESPALSAFYTVQKSDEDLLQWRNRLNKLNTISTELRQWWIQALEWLLPYIALPRPL